MISEQEQAKRFSDWCLKKGINPTEKQQRVPLMVSEVSDPASSLAISAVAAGAGGEKPSPSTPENGSNRVMEYKSSYWTYSIISNPYITGVNFNWLFEKRLAAEVKTQLPIINLLSNPKYQLACLDFDDIKKFNSKWKGFDTWESIERLIFPNMLPKGYLSVVSPSGKRKVLFVVSNCKSTTDVKNFLKQNVCPELLACADMSEGALTKMFINGEMLKSINEHLSNNSIVHKYNPFAFLLSDISVPVSSNQSPLHTFFYTQTGSNSLYESVEYETGKNEWIDYSGPIEAEFSKKLKGNTVKSLVMFLLGNPYLAMSRIGLSQDWLAKRYNVSQKAISRAIHQLMNMGLLKKLSNHYQGVCSARYCVDGDLLEIAKQLYWVKCGKDWQGVKDNINTIMLNAPIENNNWNKTLLKAVWSFKTQESYEQWFKSKEGHLEGSRAKQMASVWKFKQKILMDKSNVKIKQQNKEVL